MPPETCVNERLYLDGPYCRQVAKADGRALALYGWTPHEGLRLAGDLLRTGTGKSSLRWHPLRQEWNICAAHRQGRTFKPNVSDDPLAPMKPGGGATEIPFEDFELVVFDNQFPGLSPKNNVTGDDSELLHIASANGHCEVVVYSPEAEGSLATISQERRELLVHAWIDRYRQHYAAGHAYVLPFENRGDAVGVTLSHPHGQIYAFPFVPEPQKKAVQAFEAGFILEHGLKNWEADYCIHQTDTVSAFAPPFARFPYEVWIAPKKCRAQLAGFTAQEIKDFALMLGDIVARYDAYFGEACPFMLTLHAAPNPSLHQTDDNFHFTAQFYPLLRARGRQKYLAGVEQATGVFTVDVMPEDASKRLREVKLCKA